MTLPPDAVLQALSLWVGTGGAPVPFTDQPRSQSQATQTENELTRPVRRQELPASRMTEGRRPVIRGRRPSTAFAV